MSHIPKRPPSEGNRKVGDLTDRNAVIKAQGNQNMSGGGRYDVREMVKEDTKTAFSKVQMLKIQGQAKFPLKDGDYVELDPIKQGAMVSPQQ